LIERGDDTVQLGTLAAERLCLLLVVPDIGIFQFAAYLFQPVFLAGIVKGTP
jgi:hypothetical protein